MARQRRGIRMTAMVYYPDGTEQSVTAGLAEIVTWEKRNKKGFSNASGEVHFERQAWVIWSAAKRKGLTDKDFETWLNSIEDMEILDPNEVEEIDPDNGSPAES